MNSEIWKISEFFILIPRMAIQPTIANLLTNDALDPQALIPEFKTCAVQVFQAREDEWENPDAVVQRGRY